MSEYRLHIDIPLGTDENEAIRIANHMISSIAVHVGQRSRICLLYTSPSPRDPIGSRMPSSA